MASKKIRKPRAKTIRRLIHNIRDMVEISVMEDEDDHVTIEFTFGDDFKETLKRIYGRKNYSKKLAKDFLIKPMIKFIEDIDTVTINEEECDKEDFEYLNNETCDDGPRYFGSLRDDDVMSKFFYGGIGI